MRCVDPSKDVWFGDMWDGVIPKWEYSLHMRDGPSPPKRADMAILIWHYNLHLLGERAQDKTGWVSSFAIGRVCGPATNELSEHLRPLCATLPPFRWKHCEFCRCRPSKRHLPPSTIEQGWRRQMSWIEEEDNSMKRKKDNERQRKKNERRRWAWHVGPLVPSLSTSYHLSLNLQPNNNISGMIKY